ncbi:MAG: SPFH domain-containing protein [Clostridiales bacterium]|jgi:membrane protease subunit (stomatin/prohibitin family)|nr:SPFH domain-containing protein [Clostridiales bacterium]
MANVLKFDIDRSNNLVKLHTCSNACNKSRNIKIVVEDSCDVVFVKNGQIVDNIVETTMHKRVKSDEHKYYFVNKQLTIQEDFITKDFLEYRDYATNNIVNLGARCVVDMSVSDSKLFVTKLIDFKQEYTKQDLLREITPRVLEHFRGCLLQIINTQKIEYSQLDAQKTKIGGLLLSKIEPIVGEYGVKITKFDILQFISPLQTTLLLTTGSSIVDTNIPQSTNIDNLTGGNTDIKQGNSKELIAMIDDQLAILVDKSLDKIQLFVDQAMQNIAIQMQQLSNNITNQDKS